jgi:6-pyruvoyltetrahydropterin/6-carboxytetrahydropterin synthase
MKQQVAVEVSGIDFSAAHFVSEGGKCERLHGHNYHVAVMIWGEINSLGMVIDFREAKHHVRLVCKKWDHHILLPQRSILIKVSQKGNQVQVDTPNGTYSFPARDVKVINVVETTAEELARIMCQKLVEALKAAYPNLTQVRVVLSESSTSRAIVTMSV